MARPKKNETEKLNRQLPPVRCTDGEYAVLLGKSSQAGMTLSEYIRRASLEGKIVIRQGKFDFALADQLRRIGVNLNQQTRRLNLGGSVSPELRSLWTKLDQVLDHILETV